MSDPAAGAEQVNIATTLQLAAGANATHSVSTPNDSRTTGENVVSDSPVGAPIGDSSGDRPSRLARARDKMLRKLLPSRNPSPAGKRDETLPPPPPKETAAQETPPPPPPKATAAASQGNESAPTAPAESSGGMLSKMRPDNERESAEDLKTRQEFLDLSGKVLSVLADAAKAVPVPLLPGLVGACLKLLSDSLVVLKKMVDNRAAWHKLIEKIEKHQEFFNKQLDRIGVANEVPDPESALLHPVKEYALTLENLLRDVLEKSGSILKGKPEAWSMERIKNWTHRFIHVEMTKDEIKSHAKKLTNGMDQLALSLVLFTSFAVNSLQGTVENLRDAIDGYHLEVLSQVKRIREPHTIKPRRITVFGDQHVLCLPGTRAAILEEISVWAEAQHTETPIYCIRDVAGTGKSTIARSVVDGWEQSSIFAFFFSRESSSVGDASNLCVWVQKQIENSFPEDEYWKTLSKSNLEILQQKSIEQQWKQLVFEALLRVPRDKKYLLVIDALDECQECTRGRLLRCLLDAYASQSFPHVRTLITTRNEEDIGTILDDSSYRGIIQSKTLRRATSTDEDIKRYMDHRLDGLKLFVASPQRKSLVERCDGLFVFASLACQLLEDAGIEDPLDEILEQFTSLDGLYHKALEEANKAPTFTGPELKSILGIILVAKEPLSITAIATLLSKPVGRVENFIKRLGSVLSVGAVDDPVSILHATFTEFLVRKEIQCADASTNEYALSRSQSNRIMAESCLQKPVGVPTNCHFL